MLPLSAKAKALTETGKTVLSPRLECNADGKNDLPLAQYGRVSTCVRYEIPMVTFEPGTSSTEKGRLFATPNRLYLKRVTVANNKNVPRLDYMQLNRTREGGSAKTRCGAPCATPRFREVLLGAEICRICVSSLAANSSKTVENSTKPPP